MTSQRTFRRTLFRLLTIYLPVLIVLVLILFPFYWMVVTSFKADSELTDLGALLPAPLADGLYPLVLEYDLCRDL
jgi:ABC-type glycerol-3-phosphate transport system permease component